MPKERAMASMKTQMNVLERLDQNESLLKIFLKKCDQEKRERLGDGLAIVQT